MAAARLLAAASIVLVFGCSSGPPARPPLRDASYRSVAVLPFQTDEFLGRYGSEVADQIIIEILRCDPGFPVVERGAVDELLRERDLQSANLSADTRSALLTADLIVTGSVALELEYIDSPVSSRRARLTATVRAVEIGSGRIVWAGRFSGAAYDALIYAGQSDFYRHWGDSDIREQAVVDLAEKVAEGLLGECATETTP